MVFFLTISEIISTFGEGALIQIGRDMGNFLNMGCSHKKNQCRNLLKMELEKGQFYE